MSAFLHLIIDAPIKICNLKPHKKKELPQMAEQETISGIFNINLDMGRHSYWYVRTNSPIKITPLKDGDFLTIYADENKSEVVWQGTVTTDSKKTGTGVFYPFNMIQAVKDHYGFTDKQMEVVNTGAAISKLFIGKPATLKLNS